MNNYSYYGSFRTRTFAEIFPDATTFNDFYVNCGIPARLLNTSNDYNINTIYALLISHYASNNIKSSDENRFKLQLMTVIFQYGPIWQKEMEAQDKILALSDEELLAGSKAIYNTARNPGVSPSTGSLEELTYIDNQNTTNYRKAKAEGYAMISSYLDKGVTRRFLDKFKNLFIVISYPDYPLLYEEDM